MAENPRLVRYVSSDTNAEVIDLLKELREEEAALETATDAAPRVRRLVARLNELDPYFTFRVESDGQMTRLTATQRYADAVRDAQLGGTFSVTGDEAAHLLRGAVDYGLPAEFTAEHDVTVTMRAPGGLSYEGPVEHLALLPTPPEDDLPGVLRLLDGNVTISELPVLITPVSSGRRGGVLSGRDRAGVLMFEMRFDTEERTVTFNSSTSVPDRGALPGDFLPALTLMRAADIGMTLVVALTGDDGTLRELFKLTMEDRWIPHPEGIDLVSRLDRIQRASGQYFDLSEEFTAGDQFWIKAADRLLAGASVQVPWTEQTVDVTIVPDGREGLLRSLDQGKGRIQLRIGQQINVPIAGRVIRLGAGEAHIRGAVVANADEVRTAVDAAPPGELVSTELKLIPTEDHPPIALRMKQEPAPDGHRET
jgi:hypothetical protein